MKNLKSIRIGKKEVLPLIEGGKGVAISTGGSAGAWGACGGIGTFSGANPDFYNEDGKFVPYEYHGKTRRERHHELVNQSIKGCIAQAEVAKSIAPNSFINMNVLWEMGGCEQILEGALSKVSHLIDGITCGAGMPYALARICAKHNVFYFPIISSARAFRVLWLRSYKNFPEMLGGVVYEDPWIAGGHNGLSSAEDPKIREDPYSRLVELRKTMNSFGLNNVPIIMAGGVWNLSSWEHLLDNNEIGEIAFQFGTRPLLTQESPISQEWKEKIVSLKEGDVLLNQFSPTGFYSSAVYNSFLKKLDDRSKRQLAFASKADAEFSKSFIYGRNRELFLKEADLPKAQAWFEEGFDTVLKTPDDTIVFETKEEALRIKTDQVECMGCLSQCRFSNWNQHVEVSTAKPDPRSFCIQKTLQSISHGGSIDNNLMFSGASVFKFGQDPFYSNGFIPTVKQLIDRILEGK